MKHPTPPGKPPSASRMAVSVLMMPQNANPYGSIHGGEILRHIDEVAAMVAMRHCRANAVTAAIDNLCFLGPSHVGELVTFKANLNAVGATSMEVGVRVESENMVTGEVRHTVSAYLTFVAMDDDNRPTPAPPLLPETDEDRRRVEEARARRQARLGCRARLGRPG